MRRRWPCGRSSSRAWASDCWAAGTWLDGRKRKVHRAPAPARHPRLRTVGCYAAAVASGAGVPGVGSPFESRRAMLALKGPEALATLPSARNISVSLRCANETAWPWRCADARRKARKPQWARCDIDLSDRHGARTTDQEPTAELSQVHAWEQLLNLQWFVPRGNEQPVFCSRDPKVAGSSVYL